MITLYLWDEQRIYCCHVQADPRAAMPRCSTPTAPPAVTGEQVAQWTGAGWRVLDVRPPLPETPIGSLQARMTEANNAAYEAATAQVTAGYPKSEIDTWPLQREEVLAWQADSSAPTPWVDIAAADRGITREEYLAKTWRKVLAYVPISASLTGRRQGIDDAIRTATTPEQLAAIVIDYTLPEASA